MYNEINLSVETIKAMLYRKTKAKDIKSLYLQESAKVRFLLQFNTANFAVVYPFRTLLDCEEDFVVDDVIAKLREHVLSSFLK